MIEKDFVFDATPKEVKEGTVTWQAPSNIALVKYWGKRENQIPANPSISFTLSTSATTTTLSYKKKTAASDDFSFQLFFEGERKADFEPKILQFFKRISSYCPYLTAYTFTIETSNSFPHSSGIASSASGMAALALGIMSLEKALDDTMKAEFFYRKASFLARLGSGSASRSIEGPLMQWGAFTEDTNSSNLYAVPCASGIHPNFTNYQDTILLVEKGQKQVSSSVGHNLMHANVYAEQRFKQAHDNLKKLTTILKEGDVKAFIEVVESEALTLHAMMLTSIPYYILMKPNTLQIIQKIWEFRERTQTHVCFTLDAGANVHVLYPENEKEVVLPFITSELTPFCENGQYLLDATGQGAKQL